MTLLWLFVALGLMVVCERWINRHLQGICLLIFKSPDVSTTVYSVIMFPGVVVHETSHWLMATILGVRTGRFSLLPARLPDGTLRLGFVEAERSDVLRESLIGAAPTIAGTALILLLSYFWLDITPAQGALLRGDWVTFFAELDRLRRAADFWLILYLLFVINNSMLPSASDRRAWVPLTIVVALAAIVLFYAGFTNLLWNIYTGPLETAFRALALAFTLTVALDAVVIPLLWLLERFLMRLTGMKVNY